MRKNFIYKNEEFECENCGAINEPHAGIRNHCNECLHSKHLDLEVPGDRLSPCSGLMKPISVCYNGKKGYMIQFACTICGQKNLNKVAPDDNQDIVSMLSTVPYESN